MLSYSRAKKRYWHGSDINGTRTKKQLPGTETFIRSVSDFSSSTPSFSFKLNMGPSTGEKMSFTQ